MRTAAKNTHRRVILLLAASAMSCSIGCVTARNTPTTDPTADDSIRAMQNNVERLHRELEAKNEVIVKLTAEAENYAENNRYLEDELARSRETLDYLEKQFINLERGLQNDETKASAVAALAEAELAYDKAIREDPEALSRVNIRQAKEKIEKSDALFVDGRYNSSVYFSKRAIRLLKEKRQVRKIRIVSVTHANIRAGPGLNFAVVDQLSLGTVLIQMGDKEDWFKVATRNGAEGWIHASVTTAR